MWNDLLDKVFERLAAIFDVQEDGSQINPFMALYKKMHEVEEEQRAAAQARGETNMPNIKMYIGRVREGQHPGRYNDCQKGDIAAVFVSETGQPPADYSLCVYSRHTNQPELFELAATNENSDALCYPLINPYGERGV